MTGTLNVSIILKMVSKVFLPSLLKTNLYMCHPNERFQIIFSCPFNITINYDLWPFGFLFLFFSFLFFFSPSTEASEEPLVDLSDVLNTDADILGMLGKPSSDSGASYIISQAVTVTRSYEWSLSSGFAQSFSRGIFLTQQVYLAFTSWWFFFSTSRSLAILFVHF